MTLRSFPRTFSVDFCFAADLWLLVFQKENRILSQENLYSVVTHLRQTNQKTDTNPMYLDESTDICALDPKS